jgi:hypothetical protein
MVIEGEQTILHKHLQAVLGYPERVFLTLGRPVIAPRIAVIPPSLRRMCGAQVNRVGSEGMQPLRREELHIEAGHVENAYLWVLIHTHKATLKKETHGIVALFFNTNHLSQVQIYRRGDALR